jgi:hypothetical protein
MALRFGEGAVFLTPVLLVGPLRLRVQAWPSGIILALLCGAPFVPLVGLGLQATSATMTSTVTPALMPVFRRVSVRNWASPVSRQARSPQLSSRGWSRMPSRSSAAARRSKMIALNREDPAALDRRFVDMKPALAEAVRDDSAL